MGIAIVRASLKNEHTRLSAGKGRPCVYTAHGPIDIHVVDALVDEVESLHARVETLEAELAALKADVARGPGA